MSWITNRELVARGVPQSAIDRAVAERKLKGTRLSGDGMAFDSEAVDRWLGISPKGGHADDGPAPGESRTEYWARRDAERSSTAGTPAPTSRPAAFRSAEETIAVLAGHIVAQEGVTEHEARRRVLRDSADLRAKLHAEANQDHPARGTRPRPDLADRAAAMRDSLPTR